MSNDGRMRIFLTQESASCLYRLSSLEPWVVAATMQRRGRKAAGKAAAPGGPGKKPGRKQGASTTTFTARQRQKVVKTALAKKKKKNKDALQDEEHEEEMDPSNFDAKSYKRTKPGAKAICEKIKHLDKMHSDLFKDSPLWDVEGKCRMHFDGSSNLTLAKLLRWAPECLDVMYLSLQTIFDYVFLT